MTGITKLINEAIVKLASQPSVFSTSDVAAYADLTGRNATIEHALQAHCANQGILALDEQQDEVATYQRYLGIAPVERWWVESTLRWAKAGLECMTPAELAREMALAFDTQRWDVAPDTLVNVGRQWAMVADSYAPGVFVFPWSTVIHGNPGCAEGLLSISDSWQLDFPSVIDEVLCSLTERERDVVRSRCGLDTGHSATLEQIGNRYGVTRERIRQIGQKAKRKLQHPARQRRLKIAFAADFVQSGGSLLIPESSMTPLRTFLIEAIGLKTVHVPELGLHFIGAESAIARYRSALHDADGYLEVVLEPPCFPVIGALQFLSQYDGEQVGNAEKEYRARQVVKTRPRMLREALRFLGRAAHFEEIANVCNRMFPENRAITHNWHAALGLASAEALGIVWIGRKGMYGLKEYGYSRPPSDLFEAVAQIVETRFTETQRPVSLDFVMAELSKQRRELKRNSVMMALGFNDRLEYLGQDEYVPAKHPNRGNSDTGCPQYDVDAAFVAFSSIDDDHNQ